MQIVFGELIKTSYIRRDNSLDSRLSSGESYAPIDSFYFEFNISSI